MKKSLSRDCYISLHSVVRYFLIILMLCIRMHLSSVFGSLSWVLVHLWVIGVLSSAVVFSCMSSSDSSSSESNVALIGLFHILLVFINV